MPDKKNADQSRSLLLPAALVGLAVFFAMAFVYHPNTGWNVNTRLALVMAVVEEGRFTIDSYHDTPPWDTMDKAYYEGHHYSDKIFGVAVLALPFYVTGRVLHGDALPFEAAHWVMKVGGVALPGGISAALFWVLLCRLGAPPRRALFLTAAGVFGTMWYGYGAVFYPYVPGLACLLGALYVTFFPPARRITPWNALAVGALLGFTMLCDYLFGLVVVGVGVIWLLRLGDQGGLFGLRAFAEMTGERTPGKQLLGLAAVCAAGFFLPLAPWFAYTYSIYGEFAIPYRYEVDPRFREGMAQGFMGATYPKLHAFYFTTVHPFRGIFFWSPVLLAGLAGCILGTRQYGKRAIVGWLGLWAAAGYILFTASYYMWWGGWAMGPRFMIPMLPFVLLGAGELLRTDKLSALVRFPHWQKPAWGAVLVLGGVSIAMSFPIALADPQLPQGNQDHVLAEARIGTYLHVPHFEVLQGVYTGHLTVAPADRLAGDVWTGRRLANVLWLLFFLAVVAAGLLLAAWKAPKALPGIDRADFPFGTVDGTAAPPPG